MAEVFTVEKLENCFANARSFRYELPVLIDEALLKKLESWGELTIRRNFRRPFFQLRLPDGAQVKGILQDNILKAGFDDDLWQTQKAAFEQRLKALLCEEENV